jgi:hypothetical protein
MRMKTSKSRDADVGTGARESREVEPEDGEQRRLNGKGGAPSDEEGWLHRERNP